MALTADEIVSALLCLELPIPTDAVFSYQGDSIELRNSEIANKALTNLSAAQETKARALIVAWEAVGTDTTTAEAEGANVSPYRDRRLLRAQLARTIGMTMLLNQAPRIGRG